MAQSAFSSAVQFSSPYDVDVDQSGNMYVADSGNNRVQELDSSGTYVNKWTNAGTGQSNFSGPYGVALSVSQTYVVDTGNSRVQGHREDVPQPDV